MHTAHVAITVLGALVITLGLFSIPIERFILFSSPGIAMAVGVLVGPAGFGWISSQRPWPESAGTLALASELTMAIALMGIALRLQPRYFLRNSKTMAVLLLVVMPLMWASTSILVHLIAGIPLVVAMLIGAILTPTDPVLSTTVVHGKVAEENLPSRIREVVSAESGANDGLAYPLVYLPLLLLTKPAERIAPEWLLNVLVFEVGGAILLGAVFGGLTGRAMVWGEERKMVEAPSLLAFTLALSLFILGAAELVGVNGILAVFVAGLGFDAATPVEDRSKEEKVQEAVNQFFTVPILALFGIFLPRQEWFELGWRGFWLVTAILLLRRLPVMMLLGRWITSLRSARDAAFVGWFGPMGVAALFYATHAESKTGHHEVWVLSSLVVFSSVIVHGATGTPLTRWYGGRAAKLQSSRG